MVKISLRVALYALVVAFLTSRHASAGPIVFITPTDLGGGLFQYSLFVENITSPEPAQGLILFNASSIFGLSDFSTINAPAGWSFLAPLPGASDQLTYFSG